MKRDLFVGACCIVLSIALFAVLLAVSLKYSAWGQFVLNPRVNQAAPATVATEHPDVLSSLRTQLIVMHGIILPFVCAAVGLLAGAAARRPVVVALVSILPFRLYFMTSDSIQALTVVSLLVDVGIAVGCAFFVGRIRHTRRAVLEPSS